MKATKIYQSPIMVIGFTLFLALVIGTIYRINVAFTTYPGLVNADPYHSGLNYGESKLNADILAKQGYKLVIKKHDFIEVGKDFSYQAYLTKDKKLVKNAIVKFYFYRPSNPEYDFEKFAKPTANNWELTTKLPRKGKWRLVVEASFDDKTLNEFNKIYVYDALAN